MILKLEKEILSDMSNAFNILVFDSYDDLHNFVPTITFHAIDIGKAMKLIETIEQTTVDIEQVIVI